MEDVKRYHIFDSGIDENKFGNWVEYHEHVQVQKELEEKVKMLEDELKELTQYTQNVFKIEEIEDKDTMRMEVFNRLQVLVHNKNLLHLFDKIANVPEYVDQAALVVRGEVKIFKDKKKGF